MKARGLKNTMLSLSTRKEPRVKDLEQMPLALYCTGSTLKHLRAYLQVPSTSELEMAIHEGNEGIKCHIVAMMK